MHLENYFIRQFHHCTNITGDLGTLRCLHPHWRIGLPEIIMTHMVHPWPTHWLAKWFQRLFVSFYFLYLFNLMCVLCLPVPGCVLCVCLWNWSHKWLWASSWGLGIKPRSSARAAVKFWVISPAQVFIDFVFWQFMIILSHLCQPSSSLSIPSSDS